MLMKFGIYIVQPDHIARWICHTITGELHELPEVGPLTENVLRAAGIHNTFQLIGQFLMFKEMDRNSKQVCGDFVGWLKDIGVNSSRHTICLCVAEKANLSFP